MRATALMLFAAIALSAASVKAAIMLPAPEGGQRNIIKVWGGCGWGWHPVPGHWSYYLGGWVPPHCVPNGAGYPNHGYGNGYWNGGSRERHENQDEDRD